MRVTKHLHRSRPIREFKPSDVFTTNGQTYLAVDPESVSADPILGFPAVCVADGRLCHLTADGMATEWPNAHLLLDGGIE